MEIFAIRLNKLLEENKITMYRLAKDLGCSKSMVINWRYGLNEPRASEVARLAVYFDVSSDYLLGLENENGEKVSPDDVKK